jgi:ADP-heptose:LPS heptosyltransferase
MSQKPFPILIITATRIGDAVLSSGLIKKLLDEIPNAELTIVVGPVAAPLFRDVPQVKEVIALVKQRNGGHWIKLWQKVRHRHWGLVLDGRGSAISRFIKTEQRSVHKKSALIEHKVIEAARLLRLEADPPAPYLFTSPETEALAARMVGQGGPILAMGAAANWIGKTWPTERFAHAALRLLGPDGPMPTGRLLILGGPDDWPAAEVLRRTLPRDRWIDLTGKADLLTIYAALKHARMFIGNDSGLMHLAAAAGIPTLGLFGPSDERLYGPWGTDCRIVRGGRTFEGLKQIDAHLNQAVCHMLDLPVSKVVAAACRLFDETV